MRGRFHPARATAVVALAAAVPLLTGCTGGPHTDPPTAATRAAAASTAPSSTAATASASAPSSPPPDRLLADPTSLRVIVDKRRPLHPRSFAPRDLVPVPVPHTNPPLLRRAAATATVRLVRAAAAAGVHLLSISAYRSFAAQQRVYGEDLAHYGRAGADRQTARPGYSEHQTGLAIDLGGVDGRCALDACFGATRPGRWIAANAWRFGFVLRYPRGAERITGYEYEPWHLRYVGEDLAGRVHEAGNPPLETFFGLPAAPAYR